MTSIYDYFSIVVQSTYTNYIVIIIFGSVLFPVMNVQVVKPIKGFRSRERFFVVFKLYWDYLLYFV